MFVFIAMFLLFLLLFGPDLMILASSSLKKGGRVEDFGSRDIGGGLALISGFWGT